MSMYNATTMYAYSFLMDFISFFQMLTLLDLGMIFIDRNSSVVKLQKRIIDEIQNFAKEKLNHAGSVTQRCREDRYKDTEQGRKILGMASRIRDAKESLKETTEENTSLFMPAMGLTSGLFCLLYVMFVPFYHKTGNVSYLYFLEYFAEAIYVSQAFVLISLAYNGAYSSFLSSLKISFVWTGIPLVMALILYMINCTISCFDIMIYLISFIILALSPILTMVVRIVKMIIDRNRRINKIKKNTDELWRMLEAYRNE